MMTVMGGPILSFIWNVMEVLGILSGVKLMYDTLRRLQRRLCQDFPTDQDRMEHGRTYSVYNRRNQDRENWIKSFPGDRMDNY